MRIISICGYSKSGKTHTVVNIIKELKKQGFSVTYLKDIHEFTLDKKNSDTHRVSQAGADIVFAKSFDKIFQITRGKSKIADLIEKINTDFLLIEGSKKLKVPKILCAKATSEIEELWENNIFAISGIYSNSNKFFRDIPVINSNIETKKIVELMISQKTYNTNKELSLSINGEKIILKEYVAKTLKDIIYAYLKNIKFDGKLKNINIKL